MLLIKKMQSTFKVPTGAGFGEEHFRREVGHPTLWNWRPPRPNRPSPGGAPNLYNNPPPLTPSYINEGGRPSGSGEVRQGVQEYSSDAGPYYAPDQHPQPWEGLGNGRFRINPGTRRDATVEASRYVPYSATYRDPQSIAYRYRDPPQNQYPTHAPPVYTEGGTAENVKGRDPYRGDPEVVKPSQKPHVIPPVYKSDEIVNAMQTEAEYAEKARYYDLDDEDRPKDPKAGADLPVLPEENRTGEPEGRELGQRLSQYNPDVERTRDLAQQTRNIVENRGQALRTEGSPYAQKDQRTAFRNTLEGKREYEIPIETVNTQKLNYNAPTQNQGGRTGGRGPRRPTGFQNWLKLYSAANKGKHKNASELVKAASAKWNAA
jgi:hypothetical protein